MTGRQRPVYNTRWTDKRLDYNLRPTVEDPIIAHDGLTKSRL